MSRNSMQARVPWLSYTYWNLCSCNSNHQNELSVTARIAHVLDLVRSLSLERYERTLAAAAAAAVTIALLIQDVGMELNMCTK